MEAWFRDSRLMQIYNYWMDKRDGRPAPDRTDIDLAEVAHLLPILQIVEVTWEPLRFRHRLVGTEIVEAMGRDVTGGFVDPDLYGTAAEEIQGSLEAIARERRPYRRLARLEWHDRDWLLIEAVEMPLLDRDGRVGAILAGASLRRRDVDLPRRLVHEPLPVDWRDGRDATETGG